MVQPAFPSVRRLTVDETLRMVEVGILREDEPVELLEGVLVTMAPQGPLHAECTASIADRLRGVYADTARVREEKPIACDRHNLPEPDVAVVADKSYATRHPDGADVLLVVEVAWSSQAEDLAKADVYARAGVPVYWLIDLASQCVHVFDGPAPDGYARNVELAAGDEVALPERDVAWPVASLLSSG